MTHMRSTNSKPEPSNQLPFDKIKSRPIVFLVQEATIYVIIRKKKLLQLQFLADFMYYVITFSRFPANATKICRYDKPFHPLKPLSMFCFTETVRRVLVRIVVKAKTGVNVNDPDIKKNLLDMVRFNMCLISVTCSLSVFLLSFH